MKWEEAQNEGILLLAGHKAQDNMRKEKPLHWIWHSKCLALTWRYVKTGHVHKIKSYHNLWAQSGVQKWREERTNQNHWKGNMVAHPCNPHIQRWGMAVGWGAEAGALQQVRGQPVLYSNTLSHKDQQKHSVVKTIRFLVYIVFTSAQRNISHVIMKNLNTYSKVQRINHRTPKYPAPSL